MIQNASFCGKNVTFHSISDMSVFILFIFWCIRLKNPALPKRMKGGEWNSWNKMSLNENKWCLVMPRENVKKISVFISLIWFGYHTTFLNFVFHTFLHCSSHRRVLSAVRVCVCMCVVTSGHYNGFIIKSTGKIKGSFAYFE